jgi:hypothetical protein
MKKKKSKSKPKKEILQLYSAKDVVAKLCSASAFNDIIKEHNKIIEDCIVKITNLYEDYRNNFLYRTQKIDFLIKESSLDEAGELLEEQNLELREYSKRNEEQQILESFSTKHKLLKEKNRKLFKESGIFDFIKYSNQKYIEYLNDISDKALDFESEIIHRKLFLIKDQKSPTDSLEHDLWEEFLLDNNIKELEIDFNELINSAIQKLDVRFQLDEDVKFYEKASKRQLREIENPSFKLTGNLPWKILPNDGSWNEIQSVLRQELNLGNITNRDMIAAKIRMQRIVELNPTGIYKGLGSFSDYFALVFDRYEKVVFESIVYGNAIYVVKGDWRKLSQKSKKELRVLNHAHVIRHEGDWFYMLNRFIK